MLSYPLELEDHSELEASAGSDTHAGSPRSGYLGTKPDEASGFTNDFELLHGEIPKADCICLTPLNERQVLTSLSRDRFVGRRVTLGRAENKLNLRLLPFFDRPNRRRLTLDEPRRGVMPTFKHHHPR
jgi:hypothetical protein